MAKRRARAAAEMVCDVIAQLRDHIVPLDSVTLDPVNPNSHGEASIAVIAASLKEFGQRKPLIVNERTGVILSGNGTHAAARSLGWTHIAAFAVPDDPVANARWSVVDNRTAEYSEWDVDHLNTIKGGLAEANAWGDLSELYDLEELVPAAADDADAVPLDPPQPIAERFQVIITFGTMEEAETHFREVQSRGFKCRVATI